MRNKLLIVGVLAIIFLYWRGIKVTGQEMGLDCNYKIVYAVCTSENKDVELPGIVEILKAGARF